MIPRIVRFAPLALAIACTAVAAERRVVFAVLAPEFSPVPGEAKLYIEPIAWADPLAPPPPGYEEGGTPAAETRAFIRRYFDRGRSYITYMDGKHGGEVKPLQPAFGGCSSLGMTASGKVTSPAFATNFPLAERTLRNRAATENESGALLAYGKRWYAARGHASVDLQVSAAELIDIAPDEDLLFAATISVVEPKDCAPRAIFVLARGRDVSATRVTPQVIIAPRGSCETAGDPAFFGQLDFDADGTDEIAVRNWWIEAYQYVVIRRNAAGEWRIAVLGGVAGC